MLTEENELYIDTVQESFKITKLNCYTMQKHISDLMSFAVKKISANRLSKMCNVNCQTIINFKNKSLDSQESKIISESMVIKLFKAFHEIALEDIKDYKNYKLYNILLSYFYFDEDMDNSGWPGLSKPYFDSTQEKIISRIKKYKDIDAKCILEDETFYNLLITQPPFNDSATKTFIDDFILHLDNKLICNKDIVCNGLSINLRNLRIISGISMKTIANSLGLDPNNYRHYEDVKTKKYWIKLDDKKALKLLNLILDDENYTNLNRRDKVFECIKKITPKEYVNNSEIIDKEIALEAAQTTYDTFAEDYDKRFGSSNTKLEMPIKIEYKNSEHDKNGFEELLEYLNCFLKKNKLNKQQKEELLKLIKTN